MSRYPTPQNTLIKYEIKGKATGTLLSPSKYFKNIRVTGIKCLGESFECSGTLKHYTILCNDKYKYLFPIRFFLEPSSENTVTGSTIFHADSDVSKKDERRLQPDQFGGSSNSLNTDLPTNQCETLKREYEEEAYGLIPPGTEFPTDSRFLCSQIFQANWNRKNFTGTIALIQTQENLFDGINMYLHGSSRDRLEMAGAILVDCQDLVNKGQDLNQIEENVVNKIKEVRNTFIESYCQNNQTPGVGMLLTLNEKTIIQGSDPFDAGSVNNTEIPLLILQLIVRHLHGDLNQENAKRQALLTFL